MHGGIIFVVSLWNATGFNNTHAISMQQSFLKNRKEFSMQQRFARHRRKFSMQHMTMKHIKYFPMQQKCCNNYTFLMLFYCILKLKFHNFEYFREVTKAECMKIVIFLVSITKIQRFSKLVCIKF